MLKLAKLSLLIFLTFFLVSCDRWIIEHWIVENQTSGQLQISGTDIFNGNEIFGSISPGSALTIAERHRTGGTVTLTIENREAIEVDDLVITNSNLQVLRRDPFDVENWTSTALTLSDVEYLLIVTDDDF